MDFSYSPADEAFRTEFRAWLGRNLEYATPPRGPLADEEEGTWESTLRWHRRLYEGGWLGITWPVEYGGRGGTFLQETIVDQELERAGSGLPFTGPGIWLLGPTLIHWGTEAQKQRHLRNILSGEEIWCQGYSEPNAGSDLASLQTHAVEKDGYLVVNGSKIWTSLAHHAQWMFLLARTDSHAPKHKGISYLLVDMKTPGITISPLVQMTGARHFNQVFLDDMRVPVENFVGQRNQGWQVALTTLAFERSNGQERIMTNRVRELAQLAIRLSRNGRPLADDTAVRQKIGLVVAMGIAEVVTAPRSPWQNAHVERVIGSIRRECLDHVVIFNERHLRRVLSSYFDYYHRTRSHLSLDKDCPEQRSIPARKVAKIIAIRKSAGCTIATSASRRNGINCRLPLVARRPLPIVCGSSH